jgi:UDP:flavonoid glycosyltransferase YjiC (YdhE family)
MCITVLSAGSRGDVQPYLALAVGLKREGYKVRFVANSNFASAAANYGLEFFPIQVDSYEFVQNQQSQSWLESQSVIKLITNTIRVIRPVIHQMLIDITEASRGSELLIYHSYTLPFVYYVGKQLNIPCIPASIYPMPTREHHALPLTINKSPGKTFNILSHLLVDQITWQVFWPVVRDFWNGNSNVSFSSPYKQLLKEQRPILCGYSPTVLPRPSDLPDQVNITGYWVLDSHPDWQPDPELKNFLASEHPPIYVGFGSMGNPTKNQETAEMVLKALDETGQRAVMAAGWSGLGLDHQLPDNVFLLKSVPHEWLFPKMAAIVHHGGSGTTGAGLRSGVPNVVVPHFGDQFFWGNRVAELGVGPEPISRKKLSAERLSRAISSATHNKKMQERAKTIGAKIKSEDGVSRAIQIVRQYIN